jgi:hypothetical protein
MKVETWEGPHIRRFVLFFVLTGLGGTVAGVMIELLFRWLNWRANGYGLMLLLPWSLAGVWFINLSFHAGVEKERQRAGQGQ